MHIIYTIGTHHIPYSLLPPATPVPENPSRIVLIFGGLLLLDTVRLPVDTLSQQDE